jgi:hypothetical protein
MTFPKLCSSLLFSIPLVSAAVPVEAPLLHGLASSDIYTGCGCTFSRVQKGDSKNSEVLFSSDYDGKARVRTEAGVVVLEAMASDRDCQPKSIGDECVLTYRRHDLEVRLTAQASWVCPSDEQVESCEIVRLTGRLVGHQGEYSQSVDVEGECGC